MLCLLRSEVRRSYRSQYLQVARRLDELYAEAQARGELSRTKLWNYVSYRQLERELSAFCEAGSVIQRDALTKCLDDVFRRTMGRRVEEMDRGRFILPYSPRAVIDTAWSGDQFSDRIWRNTGELAERIRAAATQVVNGLRSTPAIKRELMRDFDVSASNAERLIDTEVAYVFNKANLMGFRERGVRRLTITNLDVNTCEKCKALEDEVFRAEDVPVLPIHPRCRCAYCVPAGGDGEEVTASGSDLDAVYTRKGVKGYGDGAAGATGAKLYSPRAQRAAEVARENGLIPARELQAREGAPQGATSASNLEPSRGGNMPRVAATARRAGAADQAEGVRKQAGESAGKPVESVDLAEAVRSPAATAQLSEPASENPEKPDEIALLRLPDRAESGTIEPEEPPRLMTEEDVRAWIASDACSKVLRKGRQRIHIPGTKEHAENVAKYARRGEFGPSTLSISVEEAHALGLKYMGTGKPFIGRKGWNATETITANERTIGTVVNNLDGARVETTVFKIHYSRQGFHISPDYPSKKQKGG